MKTHPHPHRRALGAFVPTLMVLAAPAVAQEVQTTTAPPPAAAVGDQAAPAAAPAATQPSAVQMGPSAPVVQQNIPQQRSAEEATADAAPARTAPRATARPVAALRAPAPIAKAPDTQPPAPAPVAQNQPATDANPQAAPETQPPATTSETASDTTQQTTGGIIAANWPWLAAGIAIILAIGAFFALRGRRREDVYATPVAADPAYVAPVAAAPVTAESAPVIAGETYAEPAPVVPASPSVAEAVAIAREPRIASAGPVAMATSDEDAPVAVADQAELVAPEAAAVEALTAADAPVADRPWLEMAMRPVRAGTSADDAVVEIELTIGNAGSVPADGVRISTFMFAGEPDQGEMERLLIARDTEAVPPVRIAAGEGTTLEATLSLPREALDDEVSPVIVADARYALPGGGEGHTSASFRVGVREEDGSIRPIRIGKPHMTETVDAELYGTPERV